MAMSSYFFRMNRVHQAIENIRIMQQSLSIPGQWSEVEWPGAIQRVQMARKSWDSYLKSQTEEVRGGVSPDFVSEALDPLPSEWPGEKQG